MAYRVPFGMSMGAPTPGLSRGTPVPVNPLMGRLSAAMDNPLFHVGLGLLSQGPTRYPQGPFSGAAQGLASYAAHRQLQSEQERQNAELEMRREELAAKRAEREAAREGRTAMLEAVGMASGGDPLALAFPELWAKMRLAPERPGDISFADWQGMTPEQRDAYARFREERRGGPGTVIQNVPAPSIQTSPGGGKVMVSIDPTTGEPTVTPILEGVTEGEKTAEREAAVAGEALKSGHALMDAYRKAAEAYQGQPNPLSITRDTASQARDALVAWTAQNILGKPGTEPSPKLYEQAERMVPDFAGPIDAPRFADRLAGLGNTIDARLGSGAPSPEGESPARTGQWIGAPEVGEERGGYRYRGGDPADPASWERI